jgi:hypothetical protein
VLGDAVVCWESMVAQVTESVHPPRHLTPVGPADATELRVIDWPAVPARARACLGRERADSLFDRRDEQRGDRGRRLLQEEYAEWRLARGESNSRPNSRTTGICSPAMPHRQP